VVVEVANALRPCRGVAPGDEGVGVPVGGDGSGCVGAGFAAGRAAGDAGNALGLKSASDEPEPVEPSVVWYEPSEPNEPAGRGLAGAAR
jgi:hypothetical protein